MDLKKTIVLLKINTTVITKFVTLVLVVFTAPIFHNQIITGSLVNAALFIAVASIGLPGAILIGLLPSIVALVIGSLSPDLAIMIPFIMMGNILLIFTFSTLKKYNYWTKIILASFLKFFFLFFSS